MAFLLEGETDETLAAALAFLEQQKSLTPSLQEPLELSDDSPALPSLDDPEAADILDDLSPELPAPADKAIKNISWTAPIPTPKLLSQRLFKSRQVVPCSPPQPALAKPAKTPSPTQKKKKKPYIKIAKSMEQILKKRTVLRAMESCGSNKRTKHTNRVPRSDPRADAKVFEVLLAGVEASYREVDAVFEATGLGRTEAPMSDAQMRDGVNGMYLEIFANKMLPFGMHATGEAVWQHFKGTDIPYRWFHSKSAGSIESTEDTMVESFGMDMYDAKSNTKAEFNVKQILRRYVEEDRVVVVWRSHIMPLEFSNKRFAGIHFQEKGYVVIKPRAHSDNSSDDDDFTLVQTCYIITPDLSDQSLNDDAKTGALTEFVLSSTASNISASHEMIENVLLDQVLRQRKRRE
ncbi:hypothetical protein PI126_g8065 [Phytophthora idaei]|nr:hypothetical protein PI126_g8065 [Phytophthora idaei]